MSFKRVPDANLDAQILAKKPTKPGGSAEAKRGAGGVPSLSAKPTQCAKHQPHSKPNSWTTSRPTNAKSAPLPNAKREAQGGRGRAIARAAGGAGGALFRTG
jgi:hypothetical protein